MHLAMGHKRDISVMEHNATLGLSLQFSPGKCSQSWGAGHLGKALLRGINSGKVQGREGLGGEKGQRLEDALSSRDSS